MYWENEQMEPTEAVRHVLGVPAFLLLFWSLQFNFEGFGVPEYQLFEVVN